jgi:5-methylcytosine-specific restriction enzyme A
MNSRGKFMCRKAGCINLVDKPGYCEKHSHLSNNFCTLQRDKPAYLKAFYSSSEWTQASLRHRSKFPLCKRCKDKGIIRQADHVHHHPSVKYLIANGLNPLDEKYLESICVACHTQEMRDHRQPKIKK